jgi:hypothetical protein
MREILLLSEELTIKRQRREVILLPEKKILLK